MYPVRVKDGKQMLAYRNLDQKGARVIAGTEDGIGSLFLAGRPMLGFFADRKLKKML